MCVMTVQSYSENDLQSSQGGYSLLCVFVLQLLVCMCLILLLLFYFVRMLLKKPEQKQYLLWPGNMIIVSIVISVISQV